MITLVSPAQRIMEGSPQMALISLLYAIAGFILGIWRPLWALAALVGFVAVSCSLWWQIGFPNLAAASIYLFAFFLGLAGRRLASARHHRPPVTATPDSIVIGVALAILTVVVSTALALARYHATSIPVLLAEMRINAGGLLRFNPPGLSGELQAAFVAVAGPLLLLVVVRTVRSEPDAALVGRAITAGGVLALAAPLTQWLFLDPWVRPDRGSDRGLGLVGFFQDPHSHAAYLVLIIAFFAGMFLYERRAGRRNLAGAYLAGIVGAGAVMIGTTSRSGIVAALLAIAMVSVLARRGESTHTSEAAVAGRAQRLVIAAAIVSIAAVTALSVPGLRQGAADGLQAMGLRRLAEPLRGDEAMESFLGHRPLRWKKATGVVLEGPVWGIGPHRFKDLPIPPDGLSPDAPPVNPDNAHNYFLQYAAEYGIPALLALVFLLGASLKLTLSGALRHPDAPTRGLLTGIFAGQAAVLAFMMVSHPLLLAELQAVFWVLTGLALASREPYAS